GYVGSYPLLLIGVLLLPKGKMPFSGRIRVALDGLMSLAALVTFSWYFVLGPTIIKGAETNLGKLLGAGYPIGDLVLLFCCLVLLQMDGLSGSRPAVRAMGLGLALAAAADSAFGYQTLSGAFQSGRLTDIGWSLGYMLLGYGVCGANAN